MLSAEGPRQLPGPWRLMLLGDGSPTRHLRLLTGSPVAVDLIAMEADQTDHPGAPEEVKDCLLYTSPSPRDATLSRMPSSA